MVNPYRPPPAELSYPTFFKRFRVAWKRAVGEYRRGLQRDQFSITEHVVSWIALLLILLIGGFGIVAWFYFYFESLGLLESSRLGSDVFL